MSIESNFNKNLIKNPEKQEEETFVIEPLQRKEAIEILKDLKNDPDFKVVNESIIKNLSYKTGEIKTTFNPENPTEKDNNVIGLEDNFYGINDEGLEEDAGKIVIEEYPYDGVEYKTIRPSDGSFEQNTIIGTKEDKERRIREEKEEKERMIRKEKEEKERIAREKKEEKIKKIIKQEIKKHNETIEVNRALESIKNAESYKDLYTAYSSQKIKIQKILVKTLGKEKILKSLKEKLHSEIEEIENNKNKELQKKSILEILGQHGFIYTLGSEVRSEAFNKLLKTIRKIDDFEFYKELMPRCYASERHRIIDGKQLKIENGNGKYPIITKKTTLEIIKDFFKKKK